MRLVQLSKRVGKIYDEGAGGRAEAYMHLGTKLVGLPTRAARVDVILPTVRFLVVLERQVEPVVFRLNKAMGHEVDLFCL